MMEAMKILLQEGPLDPPSEALLCNELAAANNKIEALKLSSEHKALVDRIEQILKQSSGK